MIADDGEGRSAGGIVIRLSAPLPGRGLRRIARAMAVILLGLEVWQAIIGNWPAVVCAFLGLVVATFLSHACSLLGVLALAPDALRARNEWLAGENARLETENLELAVLVGGQGYPDFPAGSGGGR